MIELNNPGPRLCEITCCLDGPTTAPEKAGTWDVQFDHDALVD